MERNHSEIDWRPFGWSIPRLLLVTLIGAFCIVLLVVGISSTAGFSAYNPNWDGTSEFRQLTAEHSKLTVATNVSQYEQQEPATTVAFISAPETNYSLQDTTILQQFVSNGGILIVSDNYGSHGNALLDSIGANARFDGQVLRDDRNNFRSPTTPIVSDVSNHEYVSEVNALTLNYGTAIVPNGATPIVNSSEFSYLVTNENTTAENADQLQQYPVVAIESIGEGQVMTIGDPSLFINTMLAESDNREFATVLVSQRSQIVIDNSHTNAVPPLVELLLVIRSSPLAAAGLLSLVLLLIAIISRQEMRQEVTNGRGQLIQIRSLIRIGQPDSVSEIESKTSEVNIDTLKNRIQDQHPEWDTEQVETVLAGILSEPDEESQNE